MKRRALVTYVSQPRSGLECRSWRVLDLPWPTKGADMVQQQREQDAEHGVATSFVSLTWLEPEPSTPRTTRIVVALAVFMTWLAVTVWATLRFTT